MVEKPTEEKPHEFGTAFMLMLYACQACSHQERLWNSRDGVVPFGHPCPKCPHGNMLHINWDQDCYAPGYFPLQGQGVWVDMPRSLVPVIVRGILNVYEGADPEGLAEEVSALYGPASPWLIRWS